MSTQPILIVDDNDAVRELLQDALVQEGYTVASAATGAEALALARASTPALLLLDLRMPDLNGDSVVARLAECGCAHVPIIVLSGDRSGAAEAKRLNAAGFLRKPFDMGHLLRLIEALTRPQLNA